jgi:hypothetical protein
MIIGKCWRQKPNARNEHPDKEGSPYLVFPLTDLNVCQAQIAQFSLRKTVRRVLGRLSGVFRADYAAIRGGSQRLICLMR